MRINSFIGWGATPHAAVHAAQEQLQERVDISASLTLVQISTALCYNPDMVLGARGDDRYTYTILAVFREHDAPDTPSAT